MPIIAVCCLTISAQVAAQSPALDVVFPAGTQAGTTVDVSLTGARLETVHRLHCSATGVRCEPAGANRFRLTVPGETPAGMYDLWAVGSNGISAARTFAIGGRPEQCESEPNDTAAAATPGMLNTVINGQIAAAGDADEFRFRATGGKCVVLECWVERIDSRLRAVLEVFDATGRRLAVNRGYFGIDPLIAFTVPADGEYVVRVHDLTESGGPDYVYRLSIDTGPRVAFTVPAVVQRDTTSRVSLFGWNLSGNDHRNSGFDRLDVDLDAADAHSVWPLSLRLLSYQASLSDASLEYRASESAVPVQIGLTDSPVCVASGDNLSVDQAQDVVVPCDVSGQLVAGDECDWYAVQARRGEVLHVEAFGQRIGSPVDLLLTLSDQSGRELAEFSDGSRNVGEAFPTDHLDPTGRWVCPADGRYRLAVRNLTGRLDDDSRRVYRLSLRREDSGFYVVAVPRDSASTGLNVPRGGRAVVELIAFRERGFAGGIRVAPRDLPAGVECPEVWLGPGVDRALLVLSADQGATVELANLMLEAIADDAPVAIPHPVRSGTVIRGGPPMGWGRLTSQLPLAVAGDAPVCVTANAEEELHHHLYGTLPVRHSPGGMLDIVVDLERRDPAHQAPVRLVGAALPAGIENQTAIIPAGERRGYVSFVLPPQFPVGAYSMVIEAQTTAPAPDGSAASLVVTSNPVSFRVQPAAFRVEIDPFHVKRVHRGETFQVAYSARRLNGFIGKLHTELATPGRITDIEGLRGRGETFVGQVDSGSLQITVNDDAPLGPQPFLRLLTVGTVEDQPTFLGSCMFPLEIVE
ncbi:MAG: hypothetical protein JNG89_05315 [Planctomycetaceae bacterium]|nr:hypothetical protein [Planctomycetaceae bacterium]